MAYRLLDGDKDRVENKCKLRVVTNVDIQYEGIRRRWSSRLD